MWKTDLCLKTALKLAGFLTLGKYLPFSGLEISHQTNKLVRLGYRFLIPLLNSAGRAIKNTPANAGNTGSIPWSGRSLGEGNGNPLQYSFLLGKSHGQRSIAGSSPWGRKESGRT